MNYEENHIHVHVQSCMYVCMYLLYHSVPGTFHHTSRQCMHAHARVTKLHVLWYIHHWTGVARAMRVSWTAAVAKIKTSWVGLQKYCSFSFRVLFLFHQVSHTMNTTTVGYGWGGGGRREGLTDTTHAHASSNAQLSPPKWWQWK